MRPTYHLVPEEIWAVGDPAEPYRALSLASEGFVHCTDGVDALVATANRHYRGDPRQFLVLTLDLDAAGPRWSIEDAAGIYPHVFGPVARSAITRVERLGRAEDGTFTGLRPLEEPRAPLPG